MANNKIFTTMFLLLGLCPTLACAVVDGGKEEKRTPSPRHLPATASSAEERGGGSAGAPSQSAEIAQLEAALEKQKAATKIAELEAALREEKLKTAAAQKASQPLTPALPPELERGINNGVLQLGKQWNRFWGHVQKGEF